MDLAKGILQGAFAVGDHTLPAVAKAELVEFHTNLEHALDPNSAISLSESTAVVVWLLSHVAPSTNRTSAVGKYLVKLVTNIRAKQDPASTSVTYSETADPRRARSSQSSASGLVPWYSVQDVRAEHEIRGATAALRVLHLLDLVLCAVSTGSQLNTSDMEDFTISLKPHLVDLIRLASPTEGKLALELHQSVAELLRSWRTNGIFDTIDCMKLREPARTAYATWLDWLQQQHPDDYRKLQRSRRVPFALAKRPKYHGEDGDAWHQLPAGAMLPHINGTQPIRTSAMTPVPLSDATLDPELLDVVNAHIQEAERIFAMPRASLLDGEDEPESIELNSLGLRVRRDPVTGKRRLLETYYGYSPGFVAELKRSKTITPALPTTTTRTTTSAHVERSRRPDRPSATPPSARQNPLSAAPPPPPPPAAPVQITPPAPPSQPPRYNHPTQQPPFPPAPLLNAPQQFPLGAVPLPQLPFQLPPRPPNWHGPWPPPPPPPGLSPPVLPPGIPPPPHPLPSQQGAYGRGAGGYGGAGGGRGGGNGRWGGR